MFEYMQLLKQIASIRKCGKDQETVLITSMIAATAYIYIVK